MNWNSATETIVGFTMGTTMYTSLWKELQPSISAASSSSLDTDRMN